MPSEFDFASNEHLFINNQEMLNKFGVSLVIH